MAAEGAAGAAAGPGADAEPMEEEAVMSVAAVATVEGAQVVVAPESLAGQTATLVMLVMPSGAKVGIRVAVTLAL